MNDQQKVHDLLEWLQEKLTEAEKALAARRQMEAVWRDGSDKTWKEAGCKMNKKQRLNESAMQGRIANKAQRDIEMIKAAIIVIYSSAEPVKVN